MATRWFNDDGNVMHGIRTGRHKSPFLDAVKVAADQQMDAYHRATDRWFMTDELPPTPDEELLTEFELLWQDYEEEELAKKASYSKCECGYKGQEETIPLRSHSEWCGYLIWRMNNV